MDYILQILAVLPATIAAVAGLIVSIRTDNKAKDIQVVVNGNMGSLRKELTIAVQGSFKIVEELRVANERIQLLLSTLKQESINREVR